MSPSCSVRKLGFHLFFRTQGTIANSLTCVQLHKRAEKIAVMLMDRGRLQDGDHVALVYPPGRGETCSARAPRCTCQCMVTRVAASSPRSDSEVPEWSPQVSLPLVGNVLCAAQL